MNSVLERLDLDFTLRRINADIHMLSVKVTDERPNSLDRMVARDRLATFAKLLDQWDKAEAENRKSAA